MKVGQKIKNLLKERGLKQKDLILYVTNKNEVTPADKARWSRFLNDLHQIPYEDLTKIAKFLNVDIDYLLNDDNTIPLTHYLPVIGKASCGVPTNHYLGEDIDYLPVTANDYREGRYVVIAEGDSMLPKIKEGDEVICDRDVYIDNGSIVHYTLNNEQSGIKKLIKDENDNPIMLVPLNDKYPPIPIKNGDELRMAKCVKVTTTL